MPQATGFSTGDAVRLTGVSYRNLDHWARTGFIAPSVKRAKGTGTERKYSFRDLLALRIARELREAGLSTQAMKTTTQYIRTGKVGRSAQSRQKGLLGSFFSADAWGLKRSAYLLVQSMPRIVKTLTFVESDMPASNKAVAVIVDLATIRRELRDLTRGKRGRE